MLQAIPSTLSLNCRLEVVAQDTKKAARFSLVANSGDPMKVAGFAFPVVIDLAGAKWAKSRTPVIADHDVSKRIGHTTKQQIDRTGIYAEGIVSSSTEVAQGFVADAKAGFPFEASVGSTVDEGAFIPEGRTVEVNGKEFTGPLIVAKQTTIRELSVTVLGADFNTAAVFASANKNTNSTEIGTTMPRNAHHQPNSTMPNSTMPNSTLPSTAQDTLAVERERIHTINAMLQPPEAGWQFAAREVEDLRAAAVAGEVALADLPSRIHGLGQLQSIRAAYPRGMATPAIHIKGMPTEPTVLEAALANRVGVNVTKHYSEQAIEAGSRLGITCMLDACRAVCEMDGRQIDFRNKETVIRAAFSTNTFADLLSNVAGKSMLDAYRAFPSVSRLIAKKLEASDFKTKTGIRLTGDVIMQELAGDGEIKHGRLTDSSYTYSIGTFARMLGLDRQSIINDDLSALGEIPKVLGRGAALAIEETFWTLVLANTGNFFHANNVNLLTGGSSVLSATSLGSAVQKFLEQVDTEGKPINAVPRYLVVPPALKVGADDLYVSKTLNVGGGSTTIDNKLAAENALFGKYEPQVSPWLGTKGGLAGASDTGWYLFGDALDIAAFGIAYLDGSELPIIEQKEQSPDKLGLIWRGWIDFGVCQIDHRGAVKSDGT